MITASAFVMLSLTVQYFFLCVLGQKAKISVGFVQQRVAAFEFNLIGFNAIYTLCGFIDYVQQLENDSSRQSYEITIYSEKLPKLGFCQQQL